MSRSRLQREEEERIKAGGSPNRRKRTGPLDALLEEEGKEDGEGLSPDKESARPFVFTDNVDEGEAYQAAVVGASDSAKKRARRGAAVEERGHMPKIRTNAVVHAEGEKLPTADGTVKVNLNKFFCREVTASLLSQPDYKNAKDKKGKPLEAGVHWECVLFSPTGANKSHPRFFRVGAGNGGNLAKHVKRFHGDLLAGCARVVEEVPAAEAVHTLRTHILGLKAPDTSLKMDLFVERGKKIKSSDVLAETRALTWFLDAQIPFSQFDSEYFRELMEFVKQPFPSATTMVQKVLPALYGFCTERALDFIRTCASYTVSYDGWSRFGNKFVSQHYHCISPQTFDYRIVLLDLVPYAGPQYAELLGGSMAERRTHWTHDLDIVAASLIADWESKGQAAGKLIFGEDDTLGCQNHRLKKVYEVGEESSGQYLRDFNAFAALAAAAAQHGTVDKVLRRFQDLSDLDSLYFVLHNDTRWESRSMLSSVRLVCGPLLLKIWKCTRCPQLWRPSGWFQTFCPCSISTAWMLIIRF